MLHWRSAVLRVSHAKHRIDAGLISPEVPPISRFSATHRKGLKQISDRLLRHAPMSPSSTATTMHSRLSYWIRGDSRQHSSP